LPQRSYGPGLCDVNEALYGRNARLVIVLVRFVRLVVFMTSTELRNMLLSTAPVTRITTTLFSPTRRYCLKQASAVADGPALRNRAADRA